MCVCGPTGCHDAFAVTYKFTIKMKKKKQNSKMCKCIIHTHMYTHPANAIFVVQILMTAAWENIFFATNFVHWNISSKRRDVLRNSHFLTLPNVIHCHFIVCFSEKMHVVPGNTAFGEWNIVGWLLALPVYDDIIL